MINAGAIGFVLKTSDKQEFEKAIDAIMSGETYFSNELLRQIIVNINAQSKTAIDNSNPNTENLTTREKEVLYCFCQGLTVTEMAKHKNHRSA